MHSHAVEVDFEMLSQEKRHCDSLGAENPLLVMLGTGGMMAHLSLTVLLMYHAKIFSQPWRLVLAPVTNVKLLGIQMV